MDSSPAARSLTTRRARARAEPALAVAVLLALLCGCGEDAGEAASGAAAGAAGGPPPSTAPATTPANDAVDAGSPAATPPGDSETTRPYVDLVAQALRAHVRRDGPVLDPAGPGWARVAQLGDRKVWLGPPKGESAALAWPEGIGTTLAFPVGPEGATLRTGSIFLKAIAQNQRVTLFLDDINVGTVPVPVSGRNVTFSLPAGGLAPGEHRLRLWFRFTRFVGKLRTPGGLGPVTLSQAGAPSDLAPPPARWTGPLVVDGQPVPALLAGPPSGWTFYVWLPEQARFTAQAVAGEAPAIFRVIVQGDASDPVVVGRIEVDAHAVKPIDIDLDRFARQPVRLVLETEGPARPLESAGWAGASLRMPAPPEVVVPGARNVILWAIDGLRADRVGFGRGGDRAATPNLDLLMQEGGGGDDLWSGAAVAEDAHRRLLRPEPGGPTLPALFNAGGRFSGYFGCSPEMPPELVAEFTTNVDLRRTSEPPETRVLLRELDSWLDVRKRTPFFVYLTSTEPRQAAEDAPGYVRLYSARRRAAEEPLPPTDDDTHHATASTPPHPPPPAPSEEEERMAELHVRYDAQVTAADYWVGQLMAILQGHKIQQDTAVVVLGTVGQTLRLGKNDTPLLVPEVLRVPIAIWHPGMLGRREHGLGRGGDLADAAVTVLELAGIARPDAWRGRSLTTSLLFGAPLEPRSNTAAWGTQVAARLGDWWLRGSTARGMQLWNLAEDPAGRVDLAAQRPIALRLIRDAMQDAPPTDSGAARGPRPR